MRGRSRRQNLALSTIPECPTFEPSLEEFTSKSFSAYVSEVEKTLEPQIGCFKVRHLSSAIDSSSFQLAFANSTLLQVVAPEGWRATSKSYEDVITRVERK